MNKQTLYFGNETTITTKNGQLYFIDINKELIYRTLNNISMIIIDNQKIMLSQQFITDCLNYKIIIVTCDYKHLPTGLILNLNCNDIQTMKYHIQINIKQPIKSKLWKKIIKYKVYNQAMVLKKLNKPYEPLIYWYKKIQLNDSTNIESRSAVFYWKHIFSDIEGLGNFKRTSDKYFINSLLNYGYSILRSLIVRNLLTSGMLPMFGIFHKNKYNHYCLADDIIEPYRSYVDLLVYNLVKNKQIIKLNKDVKAELINIIYNKIFINDKETNIINAVHITTASLIQAFEDGNDKIKLPKLI